jgi:ferric-dicitrate binding protein FerR (iron transport regulator)
MKENSHTTLARRCRAKLCDATWDSLLAERVQQAHRRQNRRRALMLSASLLLVAGAITLGAWSYHEAQAQAGMMAMIDEIAYPVVGSAFSE